MLSGHLARTLLSSYSIRVVETDVDAHEGPSKQLENRCTPKKAVPLVRLEQASPQVWLTVAFLEDILSGVASYVKADIKLPILLVKDEQFVNRNPWSD